MPWTEVRDYVAAVEHQRRHRLLALSLAVRAAQSDEKGWEAWCREIASEI